MAESPTTAEKQDSLEDSLSSEEWTIIYKKESKGNDGAEENTENEKSKEVEETVVTEDSCKTEESIQTEAGHVEQGEEAGEKEFESDDVSILSDESEPEHNFEEGRIERIEWQVERKQSVQSKALAPTSQSSDGSIKSNTLIGCSVVALILGVVIAGQIMEFRENHAGNTEIENRLRDLSRIEEKLKEINDMKTALEQSQMTIPEMKKLKDQLTHQKYEYKPSYAMEDYKFLEKMNLQLPNLLNFNAYHSRLELLEATYQNFCSTIKRINSSSSVIENEVCETPKVLSDMINFKKNLRRAFEQTQGLMTPEKSILNSAEKELDRVSDSMLSEMSVMFSRFSLKIQERLNKFGYKLNKRLCSMSNTGRTNDKFFNILLDKNFYIRKCNETANSNAIVVEQKSNFTNKKVRNHEMKKRAYEELRKDGYKNDYKNSKDYKKAEDSREYHSVEKEEYFEEINLEKSKGEVKNDNWKNSKYEKKDKHSDERKNKQEKSNKNFNNEYNKKNKAEHEFDNSFESIVREQNHDRKFEYNQRDNDYDRKSEYHNKKERDYDKKFVQYRKDNDFQKKFEYNKENGFDHEFEHKKKDRGFNQDVEHDKKEFDHKYDNDKKERSDFNRKFQNKRSFDYDDSDSKFIILESDSDEFVINNEYKSNFKKEKEFPQRPDSYKESKYPKYAGNDYQDKKDKYQPNGDWQIQRGKAREKLRNSDWYFVRADSRHKARIVEDIDMEEEGPWSPPRPHKKHQHHHHHHHHRRRYSNDDDDDDHRHSSHSRGPGDNLRKRVLRTVGRSWDFLNAKLRKYF